jgi:hypothetical protein
LWPLCGIYEAVVVQAAAAAVFATAFWGEAGSFACLAAFCKHAAAAFDVFLLRWRLYRHTCACSRVCQEGIVLLRAPLQCCVHHMSALALQGPQGPPGWILPHQNLWALHVLTTWLKMAALNKCCRLHLSSLLFVCGVFSVKSLHQVV